MQFASYIHKFLVAMINQSFMILAGIVLMSGFFYAGGMFSTLLDTHQESVKNERLTQFAAQLERTYKDKYQARLPHGNEKKRFGNAIESESVALFQDISRNQGKVDLKNLSYVLNKISYVELRTFAKDHMLRGVLPPSAFTENTR